MIRRPPRATLDRSSAASDVYKRQIYGGSTEIQKNIIAKLLFSGQEGARAPLSQEQATVSYTHLRAHETVLDLVCRLLLEKKKYKIQYSSDVLEHHVLMCTALSKIVKAVTIHIIVIYLCV